MFTCSANVGFGERGRRALRMPVVMLLFKFYLSVPVVCMYSMFHMNGSEIIKLFFLIYSYKFN